MDTLREAPMDPEFERDGIALRQDQVAVYKALVKVAGESRKAADGAGLDRRLVELINIRCSQMNGCAACLDAHVAAAVKLGETPQRLGVLSAWRESAVYSAKERAALELAEAYTRLPRHDLHEVEENISAHLNVEERSAVLAVITAINSFNLITIAAATPVVPRKEA